MRYNFTVYLAGEGATQDEAWTDAVEAFAADPGEPATAAIDEDADDESESDMG